MNSELYHLWLTSCVIFTSLLISLHPEFASETFIPIPLLFSFHTSPLNLSCSGFGSLFPFNGHLIFVIVSAHFALSRSLGHDYSPCKQTWAGFNQKAMYPQHQRAQKSFACAVVCSRYMDHCSSVLHCLAACSGHLAIRSGRRSKFICNAESGRVPTVACHSPAWLLTDFPVTPRFWLLNLMVEVRNLIKLWIEESCPSTGSFPDQVSSLTVSKGGYFNWFNTPWLWMLLPLWYGIFFFPCFAFGDQSKIQIPPVPLGNGRYSSNQGASSWAWAGDFRSTFCEITAWVL